MREINSLLGLSGSSAIFRAGEGMNLDDLTYVSIIGAGSVALGYTLPANLLWSLSNPILMLHNYRAGQMKQAQMFGVFGIIAIGGVVFDLAKVML